MAISTLLKISMVKLLINLHTILTNKKLIFQIKILNEINIFPIIICILIQFKVFKHFRHLRLFMVTAD